MPRGPPPPTPPWCGPPGSATCRTPRCGSCARPAGRCPEYRKVREGVGMLESCRRPDLVTEITLQPVRRHGVDAAIFFSDIVVPLVGDRCRPRHRRRRRPGRRPADPLPRRPRPAARPDPRRRHRHHRVGAPAHRRARVDAAHRLRRGAVHPGVLPRRGRPVEEPRAHQGADARRPASCGTTCAPSSPRSPARSCACRPRPGPRVVQLFDSWVGVLSRGRLRGIRAAALGHALAAVADLDVPRIHFGVGTGELLAADG